MVNIINKIKESIFNLVSLLIVLFVGGTLINKFNISGASSLYISNHKGMLGNLIGGFIVVLVGVSLIGPIAQELANATNCMDGSLNLSNNESIFLGTPEGFTDSFGGGGSNRFGGYDGEVKHKSFTETLAKTSIYKTEKSFFNPDCTPLPEGSTGRIMLRLVPGFFAVAVLLVGIAIAFTGLRNSGMV